MSATMAEQGGRVQPEQSNMRLALNMAKMAKGEFSRTTIEETQHIIKKPLAKVWEEKKRGVKCPGHKEVMAAIESHPAMVYNNHMDGCLQCQNSTANYPQTRWRRKGTAAPQPEPVAAPPGMPPPPGTPAVPPGDSEGTDSYEIEGMPSRWVYIHSPLPNTQFFNHNANAKDSKRNNDSIPDLLSTQSAAWQYCWHWVWRYEQPCERIRHWRRALIERNGIFVYYHYLHLADTLKYILKDTFICTIKEQCSDKGKRTWRG